MKQQWSNGRADVPQGGKSAEDGLMEGWRGMEGDGGNGGMEGMEGWREWRDGGKVCKGDFFSEGERNHWRGIPKSIYYI